MKKALTVGAAVAALLLSGGGVALATDGDPQTPECAEALAVFNDARAEHIAAVDADEAAEVAEVADKAVTDARAEHGSAVSAAVLAGAPSSSHTQEKVDQLRDELADLREVEDPTDVEITRIAEIKKRLPLIVAVLDADAKLDEAVKVADTTDAAALRRTANATDASALGEARTAAGLKAEEVCGANPESTPAPTPTPTPTPAPERELEVDFDCSDFANTAAAQLKLNEDMSDPYNLDYDRDGVACEDEEPVVDDDDSQIPVVPVGGVATGGGPLA